MELYLGPVRVMTDILVVEINDDVLVGIDVLSNNVVGPFDISFSNHVLVINEIHIPFFTGPEMLRYAKAADHYIIPEMSERIIDVFVDPYIAAESQTVLLESNPQFVEKNGIMVAPTLVSAGKSPTLKARVMNPFRHAVSIKQDEVVCRAEVVTVQSTVVDSEARDGAPGSLKKQVTASDTSDVCRVSDSVVPAHLQQLYGEATLNRPRQECDEIAALLIKYSHCFSRDSNDLGVTNVLSHPIDTGTARPVKQAPRRTPVAFADADREALQKLQQQGTIRPSSSPWACPIVLVRKKSGDVRLCVDYRKLNAVTTKDAFPLPRVQDCLDSMANSVLFSTMDITAAYNQVPVNDADIAKTAFVTKYGLFEYLTMPFGLCNAPGTFQRLMEIVLNGLQWTTCLIYLDDVIVFSSTFSDHISRLDEVFRRIQDSGLKLSPSKCNLFRTEVKFLGHIVSSQGTQPDPDNVRKLLDWPTPTCQTDVRAILGLANYYRKYIRDFSKRVRSLTDLTRKNRPFEWTAQCQQEFNDIKTALTSSDFMAYPTTDGLFILDTDACDRGLGSVLSQVQDGRERVIAYGSKSLLKSEINYCVTDKELLAVKTFILQYKHFLLGRKFIVRTDHAALKWLFTLQEPKGRIARWIELLSEFDFEIQYRPGVKHNNADGMSRCPNPRNCNCDIQNEDLQCGPCPKCVKRTSEMSGFVSSAKQVKVQPTRNYRSRVASIMFMLWCFIVSIFFPQKTAGQSLSTGVHINPTADSPFVTFINNARRVVTRAKSKQGHTETLNEVCWPSQFSKSDIKKLQENDPDIGPILKWIKQKHRPFGPEVNRSSPATRHYWHNWNLLCIKDGILFRKFIKKDGTGTYLQLLVPRKLRKDIMYQMHNTVLSGHLGQKKIREKTLQKFYWYNLREDLNIFITQCDSCASIKTPTQHPKAPLGVMPVGSPLDRIATDILGPLPKTPRGNRYILVVTDYFTKWVEIFPVPDFTAKTCARIILNEVISRYGCPCDIHSDQGSNYESVIFYELCRLLEIRKTRTSPYNPKCNGQTERFNKTLIRMIKAYLTNEQTDWDLHLGCLAAAYRATPNESTNFSPNLLMLGREVRLPAEIMFGSNTTFGDEITSYGGYVNQLRSQMQKAHDIARQHLERNASRHKQLHDGKTVVNSFSAGDLVWILSQSKQLNFAPKLRRPYEGPYLVVWKLSDLDYVVHLNQQGKYRVLNHNLLKPYEGSQTLPWANNALRQARRDWSQPQ
jgi:hypothetical protein